MPPETPSLFDLEDETPPHTSRTIPVVPDPPAPFDRGMAGSARAARRWTPEETATVDAAVEAVARRLPLFTADDVWRELGDGFPVTKGLASRLTSARHRGLVENTGETRIARRGGDHDHAQRLSLWRSLIVDAEEVAS